MKRLLLLTGILLSAILQGQIQDPVKYTTSVKQLSKTEAQLQIHFTIDKGWHIYSTNLPEDLPTIPTNIELTASKDYKLIGKLQEPKPIEEYDPNYKAKLKYHIKEVTISQKVKILSTSDFHIKGELSYMCCDSSMCLPPVYADLDFKLKGAPEEAVKSAKSEPEITPDLNQAASENKDTDARNVAPGVDRETLEIDYSTIPDTVHDTTAIAQNNNIAIPGGDSKAPKSLFGIFLICFLGGLAALLTPCVFPMIPMTVSFFTKQSKSRAKGIRNSFFYGFCIILIYVLLSVPFHIFSSISPSILNEVSTNVYLNIFFFVVFIVFAISFFGAFEITLPNSWVNKADKASDLGGMLGIFFMALTLVLVSFSCTGPLLGALLGSVLSTDGGATALTAGMAGFGLGLALPFGLFAAFPSWLNSIPSSGGWLNAVKVVLGFLELALAFKFLSNADLVVQGHLLPREVFLAIWIAIFAAMTLYLFGAFRLPHDSPLEKISVPRLLIGLFSLMFTIYLIPGLWGAPLKVISGFPPPMFYSESPNGIGGTAAPATSANQDIPKGADPEHCPHNLNCFHDFETGMAYAKQVNKPVMLDFTGWACVNCRKMEEQVWSDPRVLDILRNDVVLISLYVDEKTKLPKDQQYISEITGSKVRTIGNKWSEFQIKNYQTNSQPQYILIGHHNLKPLVSPASYDPDIEKFINWLHTGISRFKEQQNEVAKN